MTETNRPRSKPSRTHVAPRTWPFAALLSLLWLSPAQGEEGAAPIAESPCRPTSLVDAEWRDAAVSAFNRLVVHAPGHSSHGAIRAHQAAGHVDPQGRAWHHVTAYAANLAMMGVIRVSPQALPVAADWLRWQARHVDGQGRFGGVVHDHWVREGGEEESPCPPGAAARLCAQVDAHDSTAASTLLLADAYVRFGGDANLLREPPIRAALEAAALTLQQLSGPFGLTHAKFDHPVVYTMDAVEVLGGWRAWARLQQAIYVQPASADNTSALAQRTEAAVKARLWHRKANAWRVSLDAGAPVLTRWYPDTVAQAWPLLWGLSPQSSNDGRRQWRRAITLWEQGRPGKTPHWSARSPDANGFWWPAVAVASHCAGDSQSAADWVRRARAQWMRSGTALPTSFHVGDFLWLLWMADPVPPAATGATQDAPLN